jgi:hypothetical protein
MTPDRDTIKQIVREVLAEIERERAKVREAQRSAFGDCMRSVEGANREWFRRQREAFAIKANPERDLDEAAHDKATCDEYLASKPPTAGNRSAHTTYGATNPGAATPSSATTKPPRPSTTAPTTMPDAPTAATKPTTPGPFSAWLRAPRASATTARPK